MASLIGLETPAAIGTRVQVVPSPFDTAPDYVGLIGTITEVITSWEITEGVGKGWRTQYRVTMDENGPNRAKLDNPPTGALGPLWTPTGSHSFIMLDHELVTYHA